MADKQLTPEESARVALMLQHLPAWISYRGLTQRNIAGTLDVSEATVSKWVRGISAMSISQFVALAQLLRTSPEGLLLPPEQEADAVRNGRAAQILGQLDAVRTEQWLAVGESMAAPTKPNPKR